MNTIHEAIENLKPIWDAAKQWDIIRRVIDDRAKTLVPDYPSIANLSPTGQLHAITESLKGVRLANIDLHAEIDRLEERITLEYQASKVFDAAELQSLRAENAALREELKAARGYVGKVKTIRPESTRCSECGGTGETGSIMGMLKCGCCDGNGWL